MYWCLILFCHLLSLKTFTQYLTEFKAYTEDKELNRKLFLFLQQQTVLCRNSDESDETEMKRVNMGKCRPVTMERGGKMETLQMKSYSEGWRKIVKRSSLGDTSGWWYHQVRWETRKKTSLGEKWNLFWEYQSCSWSNYRTFRKRYSVRWMPEFIHSGSISI